MDSLWKTTWQLHSMVTYSPEQLCVVLLALDSLSHLGRNHLCRFSVAVPDESDHEQINR